MRKPSLCTQSTPIHITVCISFTLDICKLHEIPYINGVNCINTTPMITYKVIYLSLKSKNVVKFYVHISPVLITLILMAVVPLSGVGKGGGAVAPPIFREGALAPWNDNHEVYIY